MARDVPLLRSRASHLASAAQVDLDGPADSRRGGVIDGSESAGRSGEGSLPSSDAHATGEAGTAARLPAPEPRYDAEDSGRNARHLDDVLPHQAAAEERNGVINEHDSRERQHRYTIHLTRSLPLGMDLATSSKRLYTRAPTVAAAPSR